MRDGKLTVGNKEACNMQVIMDNGSPGTRFTLEDEGDEFLLVPTEEREPNKSCGEPLNEKSSE